MAQSECHRYGASLKTEMPKQPGTPQMSSLSLGTVYIYSAPLTYLPSSCLSLFFFLLGKPALLKIKVPRC